jgi:aryl-alcohol dehydrogenase-like predicted oxidoreductase
MALGTASFSADDAGGRADAAAKVGMALDAGINLFDTADVYSGGVSETLLGHALRAHHDDAVIATKVRYPSFPGLNGEGLSRRHLMRSAEASLSRLQTDRIDLYQLHEWDGSTLLEETLGALDALVRSGKVLYVGVSNFAGWQLSKAMAVGARHGFPTLASQQIHYSPYTRDAEYELIPISLDTGVGILVWSPLGGGLLTGRYDRSHGEKIAVWREPPVPDLQRYFHLMDVVKAVAEELSVSPSHVVLAWTRDRPGVTSVVLGGRSAEQLAGNLRSGELCLTRAQAERIEEAARPQLIYPFWHQMTVRSRLSPIDLNLLGPHIGTADVVPGEQARPQ